MIIPGRATLQPESYVGSWDMMSTRRSLAGRPMIIPGRITLQPESYAESWGLLFNVYPAELWQVGLHVYEI